MYMYMYMYMHMYMHMHMHMCQSAMPEMSAQSIATLTSRRSTTVWYSRLHLAVQ